MKTKTALLEIVTNWTQGTARAITQQDRKMLAELLTCLDPFPNDLGEQLGVPGGSTFGEVAEYIRDVLEEAGMGVGVNSHLRRIYALRIYPRRPANIRAPSRTVSAGYIFKGEGIFDIEGVMLRS